jgi:CHASE3 domain sensor protein/GAF domain-containing protein
MNANSAQPATPHETNPPPSGGLRSMKIGMKLALSLGTLAALTILVVLISYLASADATQKISRADDQLFPALLASQDAETDLLHMLDAMQAYLVLGEQGYRDSYRAAADAMNNDLARMDATSDALDAADKERLAQLKTSFDQWNKLPDRIFGLRDSQLDREPAYNLFKTQALPWADQMATLLAQMNADRRTVLQSEIKQGRVKLNELLWVTLASGVLAIVFGLAMLVFLRGNIGGPIVRLTHVAEQIRSGDLAAEATVESGDEIGTLARSFNRMTRQLRRTLLLTRREQKRADDLLTVVIPIGIQLSAEKELNPLLENIVIQAKSFCHADCGILYLRNADGQLQPIVVRDDLAQLALGGTTGQPIPYDPIPLDDPMRSLAVRAAWFGNSVNVPDAVPADDTNFISPAFAEDPYANNTSFLALPLKSSKGQVMGVLQLTGAQDPDTGQIVPFDSHLQQLMESFSSLAAAALEAYLREQGLQQQIQQLRIEIDEVKRQQQVKEIVETDFFQNLQSKARALRERSQQPRPQESGDVPT